MVRQCLDKEMCTNFHDYFSINEHNRNTRNMAALINIPKVKAVILFLWSENL